MLDNFILRVTKSMMPYGRVGAMMDSEEFGRQGRAKLIQSLGCRALEEWSFGFPILDNKNERIKFN